MEKRTLSAAYKFYCNKELTDAHSAEADTLATLEVLEAQVQRYEGETAVDNLGNKLGIVTNNMQELHELSATNMVDVAGRIVYNQEGIEVFNFGKHRNKPVEDVLKKEPSYFDWMMNGEFAQDTKRVLTEIKLRGLGR